MIQETAKAAGDLILNKIADKITRVSKTLAKNNSETNEEEITREKFIPPELWHKVIDDPRLIVRLTLNGTDNITLCQCFTTTNNIGASIQFCKGK